MAQMVVFYDGYCAHCRRAAALLKRLDWLGRLEPRSFRTDSSYLALGIDAAALERALHVSERRAVSDGVDGAVGSGVGHGVSAGFAALVALARHLPLLWPALPALALAGRLGWGERAYRWLAARRTVVPDPGACAAAGCSPGAR